MARHFKIEKNVPLINPARGDSKVQARSILTATMQQLEVGDSFTVPNEKNLHPRVHGVAKRIGIKTAIRRIDQTTARIWRVADKPSAEQAPRLAAAA